MNNKAKVSLSLFGLAVTINATIPEYLPAFTGTLLILLFVKMMLRKFAASFRQRQTRLAQERIAAQKKQHRVDLANRRKALQAEKARVKAIPMPMPIPTPNLSWSEPKRQK